MRVSSVPSLMLPQAGMYTLESRGPLVRGVGNEGVLLLLWRIDVISVGVWDDVCMCS